MQEYTHTPDTELKTGSNVFGLPRNFSENVRNEIYILHSEKLNKDSSELIQLKGVATKGFSGNAHLPNLDVAMLRFPVDNVGALYQP